MKLQDMLCTYSKDSGSDLGKAMSWIHNTMRRGENSFRLSACEFKDVYSLHNNLVELGYCCVIYFPKYSEDVKISVWW